MQLIDALARESGRDFMVLWAFDGASRGNPGDASFGVCAWWGEWSRNSFQQGGLIFSQGATIGKAGNNVAEAVGLNGACKGCLRFCAWISEQAARRAYET